MINRLIALIALPFVVMVITAIAAAPLTMLAQALVPLVAVGAVAFCLIRVALYFTNRR